MSELPRFVYIISHVTLHMKSNAEKVNCRCWHATCHLTTSDYTDTSHSTSKNPTWVAAGKVTAEKTCLVCKAQKRKTARNHASRCTASHKPVVYCVMERLPCCCFKQRLHQIIMRTNYLQNHCLVNNSVIITMKWFIFNWNCVNCQGNWLKLLVLAWSFNAATQAYISVSIQRLI